MGSRGVIQRLMPRATLSVISKSSKIEILQSAPNSVDKSIQTSRTVSSCQQTALILTDWTRMRSGYTARLPRVNTNDVDNSISFRTRFNTNNILSPLIQRRMTLVNRWYFGKRRKLNEQRIQLSLITPVLPYGMKALGNDNICFVDVGSL